MRAVAIALTCLAASVAQPCFSAGQDQLKDAKVAIEQVFWPKLYGKGGNTLYCDQPFTGESSQYTASAVYTGKQVKSALRCMTENQCRVVNPAFDYLLADLHNLYPELTRVELARRNAQFGEVGDDVPSKFADIGCDLKATFQLIEPRDAAKGDVARAIFYMHQEYGLPIVGQLQMYQRWNELDPPDAAEKTRNEQIEMLQGNRNAFIDNPELAKNLKQD
ncbi:endonuclease [Pseudomonas sp. LS44]|uniref:endonuclease n=1 Tax=Pseudomonas sp. LS44 TaxID=1357074 RepID=UPI00215A458C|nr:endonuclease [Pseudomonas sp. LS44]UVE17495.1 endonuclease [Pseudomonas sp. LS44]